MTDTMEPLRVDGYEFSDARLSALDSGAFSVDVDPTAVDDDDESDVGESFELRRLKQHYNVKTFYVRCFTLKRFKFRRFMLEISHKYILPKLRRFKLRCYVVSRFILKSFTSDI